MTSRLAFIALAAMVSVAFPALPLGAQGRPDVLPQGQYICALPGSAAGAAWNEEPKSNFVITGASGYRTGSGSGTYLLVENRIEFTRGPLKGRRFLMMSSGLLQELLDGTRLGRLRCHRAGPATI